MTVNILGTEYKIKKKRECEDVRLKGSGGYCDSSSKTIVLLVFEEDPMNKDNLEHVEKQTLRHEIIHAFLSESGLEANGLVYEGSWAQNEEMIDWFALQIPKIYKAFEEVNAI